MNPPTPLPPDFPTWMLYSAFYASLCLTILVVFEILSRIFRKSNLEIALTREVFFRLLESGESIYANVVLVAHNIGALITGIDAELIKMNGATKQFELKVTEIGEKYRAPDGTYPFAFHSTSPLTFVPVNSPQRQVYICEHESYAERTRQEFKGFQQRLYEIKEKYFPFQELDQNIKEEVEPEILALISNTCTNIMDQIQIESGEYTLKIKVKYRQKGKLFNLPHIKEAESSIQFTVTEFARESIRYTLMDYLEKKFVAFMTNRLDLIPPMPEYLPSNIIETDS